MSGRKSKEARRLAVTTPRPAQSTHRDPRLLLGVAALAAVLIVGSIVGVSLISGNSRNVSLTSGAKLPDAAAVAAEFRGVPQHGLVLGAANAPVTLVEYIDLQCPWCGKFERESFPTVVSQFVRTGKVRVEMRPVDFVGPDSVRGRNALFAAAAQNKAFQFTALLYANQGTENTGWLTDEMVGAAARSIPGADVAQVVGAGPSASLAARIERQRVQEDVTGVPTFFVKRSGEAGSGQRLVNPGEATLTAALRNA